MCVNVLWVNEIHGCKPAVRISVQVLPMAGLLPFSYGPKCFDSLSCSLYLSLSLSFGGPPGPPGNPESKPWRAPQQQPPGLAGWFARGFAFEFLQVQQMPCPIWYLGVTSRHFIAMFDKEFPMICLCSIYPPCAIILGEASIITARPWFLEKCSIRVPNWRIILQCAEYLNVHCLHPDTGAIFLTTETNSISLSNNIHTFIMGLDLVEDVEKDFLQKLSWKERGVQLFYHPEEWAQDGFYFA